MKFIIFVPKFDRATEYSYIWGLEIEAYSREKGHENINLLVADAVKEKLEEAFTKNPDAHLVFYDHGNEDCLWGNNRKHVVDLTNNFILKNKEVFTMACLSSKKLGADSYLRYGTTYWGSYETISFTTDAVEDFGLALNFPIKLRMDGESDWNVIMDKTLIHDNEVIDTMIGHGKIFAAALMRENRDARRVWTDKTPPSDEDSDSTCFWRRLALKLFGRKGWRVPNPHAMINPPRI